MCQSEGKHMYSFPYKTTISVYTEIQEATLLRNFKKRPEKKKNEMSCLVRVMLSKGIGKGGFDPPPWALNLTR